MRPKYFLAELKLWECIFIPGRVRSNIGPLTSHITARTGMAFTGWAENGGTRIMRIDPAIREQYRKKALSAYCRRLIAAGAVPKLVISQKAPPPPGRHLCRCRTCDGRFIGRPGDVTCVECAEPLTIAA